MKKENYTIQLEPDFVEKMDNMANKLGLSRSQLMRNILITGFEDMIIFDKLGLIAAVQFGRKVKDYKDKLIKEILAKNTD